MDREEKTEKILAGPEVSSVGGPERLDRGLSTVRLGCYRSDEKQWTPYWLELSSETHPALNRSAFLCEPFQEFDFPRGALIHFRVRMGENLREQMAWIKLGSERVELGAEFQPWRTDHWDWSFFKLHPSVDAVDGALQAMVGDLGFVVRHAANDVAIRGASLASVWARRWGFPEGSHVSLWSLSSSSTSSSRFERASVQGPSDLLEAVSDETSVLLLEGCQRMTRWMGQLWSSLSLALMHGGLDGVVLKDEADLRLWQQLLERGYRLTVFGDESRSLGLGRADHSLRGLSSLGPLGAIKKGAVLVGGGAVVDFSVKQMSSQNLKSSDLKAYRSGDTVVEALDGLWMPEMRFECDSNYGGLRRMELYRGEELLQVSDLRTPLKRGESVMSPERLEAGQALWMRLLLDSGRELLANPIYFGSRDMSVGKRWPLELHAPLGGRVSLIVDRFDGRRLVRELSAAEVWADHLSLNDRVEIWMDGDLVWQGQVWQKMFEESAQSMRMPMGVLEQLDLWESMFPLKWQLLK